MQTLTDLNLKAPAKAIIVSGYERHFYADLMAQGIFNDYLTKPVTFEQCLRLSG